MEATTEAHPARSVLRSALKELHALDREHRKETAALRQRVQSAREDVRKTQAYSDAAGEKLTEVEDRYEEHRQAAVEAAERWIATDEDEALESFRFHHSEMNTLSALSNILMGEARMSGNPSRGADRTRFRELRKELRDREGAHETERLNVLSEALATAFRRSDGRIEWREETADVLGCTVPEDCAPIIRDVLVGEIEDEEIRGALQWAHKIVTKEGGEGE
jgi:DNA gyrase/topoisomerase IV subunit A